jgi:hypothetical protein
MASPQENPYQSPLADLEVVGVLSGQREDVRKVAVYQKGILVCILINICAVLGQFAAPVEIRPLIGIVFLPVGIAGLVFTFLLATKVYGTGMGVLLGILAIIPLLGFFVLMAVDGKATKVLRANGHHVGLLGASLSQFD